MSRPHHKGGEPSQRICASPSGPPRHGELLTRGEIDNPALEGQVVTIPYVG